MRKTWILVALMTVSVFAQAQLEGGSMPSGSIPSGQVGGTESLLLEGEETSMPEMINGVRIPERERATLDPNAQQQGVEMKPHDEFVSAAGDYNPGWLQAESEAPAPDGDQFLGELRADTDVVYIICIDHMVPDGDRVKVSSNGDILRGDLTLTGSPYKMRIDLSEGFNKIDIVALNQGQSGPNTAAFQVYDEAGTLLSSNKWNLATGSTASLVVVRE